MQDKISLINRLYDNGFLEDHEEVLMANGFESAIIGVTAHSPKAIIYDYYKAVDLVMKEDGDLDLEDAIEWLEDHISVDLGESTPIFIKQLI